jgi:hypothetical protein
MWTDTFTLTDKDGNVLNTKAKVQHLKPYLDELGIKPGEKYFIKSEITGWTFEVTSETTQQDWREFADDCLRACD